MSDEQRITKVEKEKDPRKVEAGRKLSAVSKAAKERKAKQRAEAEQTTPEESKPSEGYSVVTILTGVGVLADLVCLYFTYRQDRRAQARNTPKSNCQSGGQVEPSKQQQSEPLADSKQRKSCKLHSLDD